MNISREKIKTVILILSEAKGRTYALPASCTGPFGFAQGRLSAAKNAAQDDIRIN